MNTNLSLANATFSGEATSGYAGTSVAGIGDINNDGYDDFLIGAPNQDSVTGVDSGKAYLFFGNSTASLSGNFNLTRANATFYGEKLMSYAGCAVAAAGDVNHDGFDDFLIGAYNASIGAKYGGKVYLFYGNVTSTFHGDMNLNMANASFGGEWNGDHLGSSVAGVGDVNDDGFDDILIGAPGYSLVNALAGKAYLFYGNSTESGNLHPNIDAALANASFYEIAGSQLFGGMVAGAGDVNHDGFADMLFSAPYNSEGASMAGKVYLMYGNATGILRPMMRMDKLANASFIGTADADFLGMGLAGIGDVNNDSFSDFLMGAYWHTNGTKLSAGASYLFLGNNTPGIFTANMSVAAASAMYVGAASNDQSGRSVAGAGDVNHDGFDDFLIGSSKDMGGGGEGMAFLVYGGTTSVILGNHSLADAGASFYGIGDFDDASNCVAGAGDVNHDGYADILIGAHYAGVLDTGAAYLIWGPDYIAPAAITDLTPISPTTHHVTLTWTAPGDDGMAGNVSGYIIKYSLTPITAGNFNAATSFNVTGPFAQNGTQELQVVTTLLENKQYYFAVKAYDDWNNTSPISNVVQVSTLNLAPAAVVDLKVIATTTSTATLNWTAPGNDGMVGNVSGYSVKYSKYPITFANYSAATSYNTASWDNFVGAGQVETRVITGLAESTWYYFAIEAVDDALNYGSISNVPYNQTGGIPPAAVANLALTNPTMGGFTLTWTAPGDDGMTGNVSGYVLRYSMAPITAGNFDSATLYAQAWTQLSASGALESRPVMGLTCGTAYWFAIKAFDAAGNFGAISNVPSEYTLNDTYLPAVTAPQDVRYTVGESGATITWTITDPTTSSPTYRVYKGSEIILDHQPWVSGTPIVITVSGLPAGDYSFTIVANDGYGNLVADEVAVTVSTASTTPPEFPWPEIIAVLALAAVVLVLATRLRRPKVGKVEGKRQVPGEISTSGKVTTSPQAPSPSKAQGQSITAPKVDQPTEPAPQVTPSIAGEPGKGSPKKKSSKNGKDKELTD